MLHSARGQSGSGNWLWSGFGWKNNIDYGIHFTGQGSFSGSHDGMDTVVVGMVIMNLVMMETTLEVVKATMTAQLQQ